MALRQSMLPNTLGKVIQLKGTGAAVPRSHRISGTKPA
jgi:hypothetical protein